MTDVLTPLPQYTESPGPSSPSPVSTPPSGPQTNIPSSPSSSYHDLPRDFSFPSRHRVRFAPLPEPNRDLFDIHDSAPAGLQANNDTPSIGLSPPAAPKNTRKYRFKPFLSFPFLRRAANSSLSNNSPLSHPAPLPGSRKPFFSFLPPQASSVPSSSSFRSTRPRSDSSSGTRPRRMRSPPPPKRSDPPSSRSGSSPAVKLVDGKRDWGEGSTSSIDTAATAESSTKEHHSSSLVLAPGAGGSPHTAFQKPSEPSTARPNTAPSSLLVPPKKHVRMLNGRVYGAKRYTAQTLSNPFATVREEPEFVEWGYGGMGTVQASAGIGNERGVLLAGSSFGAPSTSTDTGAGGNSGEYDDHSGMEWVRRRRAEREANARSASGHLYPPRMLRSRQQWNMQEKSSNSATDVSVYTSTVSTTTSDAESLTTFASTASTGLTTPSTSSLTSRNLQRRELICSSCRIAEQCCEPVKDAKAEWLCRRCILLGLDCDLPRAAHLQSPSLGPGAQRPGPAQHLIAPHFVGGPTEPVTQGSWTHETNVQYSQQPESVLAPKGSLTGKTIDFPLEWLHDSSCTEIHEKFAALHLPSTCSWLYNSGQYARWWSRNDSFLWLQGKAGSGKSVLAYSVIEHLKKSQDPVVFFYCNNRDDSYASAARVMRSLLYQMLQYLRESPSGMQAADRSLINDIFKQRIYSDYQQLPSLVARTAQNLHRPPCVIIDALDECKDIEWLLEALTGWSRCRKMRIFVTSRPLQIIKEKLVDVQPKSVISWDQFQKWASSDITKFISKELDTWKWSGEALLVDNGWKEKIMSVLSEKAEGVFLWAKYQLDMLGRCSNISEIREILNKLPPPVELFDRIILGSDIQKVGSKFIHRILAWLVCALRPIRLCEIVEALMIDVDQRTMEPEQLRQAIKLPVSTIIPSRMSLELEIGNALLRVLGSLVTHDEETGFLTFLHSSLGTYLTDPSTNAQHRIDLQDAHEEITATCMCYLSLCLRECLISINDEPPFRITSYDDAQQSRLHYTSSPLLDYILTKSFHHLQFLLPGNEAVLGDMSALESDLQRYLEEWEYLRKLASHAHPWPSSDHDFMLYTLIAFSPDWLLRTFLDRESLFRRLEQHQGTNPLVYAAHFGTVDQARTLLSRGANLHNYGRLIDDAHQALPLVAAVKGKSTEILDLFLEWQSPIPLDVFTDLSCNPSSYTLPVIRRLLQTDDFLGWMEHSQGQHLSLYSFLPAGSSMADEEDLTAVIWRLIQVGLDPRVPAGGGRTVFHLASEKGCLSLVEYLVSIGVQLPHNILFSVLECGNLNARTGRMTRYLLREGADANSRLPPDTGDTVLHTAIKNAATPSRLNAQSGLIEVVMALVDSGADTSSRNPENYTPLHLAIIGGHVPVVRYLFEVAIPLPDDLSFALSLAPPSTQEEIREILARSG